jgi:hypothetical protein
MRYEKRVKKLKREYPRNGKATRQLNKEVYSKMSLLIYMRSKVDFVGCDCLVSKPSFNRNLSIFRRSSWGTLHMKDSSEAVCSHSTPDSSFVCSVRDNFTPRGAVHSRTLPNLSFGREIPRIRPRRDAVPALVPLQRHHGLATGESNH